MRTFKLFWTAHKWTGIVLATVFSVTSVTGFLLLIKKRADWIQPPTMTGAPGTPDDFIGLGELFSIVLAEEHPDFRRVDDVDRVDARPEKRVYKVQSKHHHSEIQVCAVTGAVLRVAPRRSDLFEDLHDGSFFGAWVHAWIMPLVSAGLLFLVGSGLWLWIEPVLHRRRRRRQRRDARQTP